MRIYFSGDNNLAIIPEKLIADRSPHVMLSYYSIYKRFRGQMVKRRLKWYLKNERILQKRG